MYHPLFTIVLHAAIIIHIIYIVRDVIIAHVISADAQIYTRLVYYVASPRWILRPSSHVREGLGTCTRLEQLL